MGGGVWWRVSGQIDPSWCAWRRMEAWTLQIFPDLDSVAFDLSPGVEHVALAAA